MFSHVTSLGHVCDGLKFVAMPNARRKGVKEMLTLEQEKLLKDRIERLKRESEARKQACEEAVDFINSRDSSGEDETALCAKLRAAIEGERT